MHFKPTFVASLLLGSSLLAPMSYAAPQTTNCGASYYCYKSMTPGPISTPDNSVRIDKLAAASGMPARPVAPSPATPRTQPQPAPNRTTVVSRPVATPRPATPPARVQPVTTAIRTTTPPTLQPASNATRTTTPPTLQPATNRVPTTRPSVLGGTTGTIPALTPATSRSSTVSVSVTPVTRPASVTRIPSVTASTTATSSVAACGEMKAKLSEVERQATIQSRNGNRDKAQTLFKIAGDLRSEAKKKNCAV